MAKYFQSEYELERFLDKQIAADCIDSYLDSDGLISNSCQIFNIAESDMNNLDYFKFN
jgi:hypothetical protein